MTQKILHNVKIIGQFSQYGLKNGNQASLRWNSYRPNNGWLSEHWTFELVPLSRYWRNSNLREESRSESQSLRRAGERRARSSDGCACAAESEGACQGGGWVNERSILHAQPPSPVLPHRASWPPPWPGWFTGETQIHSLSPFTGDYLRLAFPWVREWRAVYSNKLCVYVEREGRFTAGTL